MVLLKSVTGVKHWVGTSGVALYVTDAEYLKSPAITVLLMRVPERFSV